MVMCIRIVSVATRAIVRTLSSPQSHFSTAAGATWTRIEVS